MKTIKSKIKRAKEIIKQSIDDNGDNVGIACSFGKDSMTLVHLAISIKPDIKIFTILTPFKFKETYDYACDMQKRYNLNVVDYGFGRQMTAEELRKLKLPYGLWQTDSEKCCMIYKVEPMKKAIKDLKLTGLIVGVRRDEGKTRADCQEIETKQGILKYNAILDFTELDVWKYLAINGVPPHPLYAEGYRSLGCEPCSGLCDDSKGERDGRWAGTKRQAGECQIHTIKLK